MSKFFIRIAAVIVMAGLVLGGCGNPAGGGRGADKAALTAKIAEAEGKLDRTVTRANATAALDVPIGFWWATEDDKADFIMAISIAEAVQANPLATQSEVDAAVSALDLVMRAFGQPGTATPLDTGALSGAIIVAQNARNDVTVAENAAEVAQGAPWATQTQAEALEAAIEAAQSVLDDPAANEDAVEGAVAALELAISAFNDAVNSNPPAEKSTDFTQEELTDLIARAKDARTGVQTSTEDGNDIPPTAFWVLSSDLIALNNAINTAEAAEFSDAVYLALSNALTAFNAAKTPGVTPAKGPLFEALRDADTAMTGVEIAASAGAASSGSEWVTQTQMNVLQAVYDSSLALAGNPDATQNAVSAAVTALASAVETFEDAIESNGPGTMVEKNSITITGLGGLYINGTDVEVRLYSSNEFVVTDTEEGPEEELSIEGEGTVQNGSLTIDLYLDGDLWAGSGSYYAAFSADGTIVFISNQKINFSGQAITVAYSAFGPLIYSMNLGEVFEMYNDGESFTSLSLNAYLENVTESMPDGPYNYTGWQTAMKEMMEEEFGENYVNLNFLDYKLYTTKACTSAFSGTSIVGPDMDVFCKAWIGGGGEPNIPAVGYITGTISFTGYTGQRPQVRINAEYFGQGTGGGWVDDRGSSYTVNANGTFSIPFTQEFLSALLYSGQQELAFRLYVDVPGSDNDLRIYVDDEVYVTAIQLDGEEGNKQLNVGSLGQVSLASITLSGTISVKHNGQTVDRVEISANTKNYWGLGYTQLTSPGNDASWSITIPAFTSSTEVFFSVRGYEVSGGYNSTWTQLFSMDDVPTSPAAVTAYNSNVGNIAITLGDVETITLSGTINVTYNGQRVPKVEISAYTQQQGGLGYTELSSPASGASWSITMLPLETDTEVYFWVYGYDENWNQLFSTNSASTTPATVTAYNGNVENIAITYSYSYSFPPSSSTALTLDQWTDRSLSAGQEAWYSFPASGGTYYVSWNDGYVNNGQGGDGTKTCDIKVTAYTGSGSVISGFSQEDSAYATPKAISGKSGTIYLKVQGYSESDSGTYAIRYSQTPGGGPLAAPSNIMVIGYDSDDISLSWNGVYGASSYNVYRAGSSSGQYSRIGSNVSDTSYTDSGLSAGTTYYYKVAAVDSYGTEGQLSSYAQGATADNSGSFSNGSASLDWNNMSAAAGQ
jgi:hypothetical protein